MKLMLDADVLIGALDGNDGHHQQAREHFIRWKQQSSPRFISAVNLTEVLVAPSADSQQQRAARRAISNLGVAVHRPGETVAVAAAQLRSRYPISLADAYCLASAKDAGAAVVSFDQKVIRAAKAERIEHVSAG